MTIINLDKDINDSFLDAVGGSIKKALLIKEKSSEYEQITKLFDIIDKENLVNFINSASIIYENKDYLKNRQKTIVRNREKLYNDLLELSALSDDFKVYNSCANFVFVKTSFGKDLWNYLKDNSIVIRFMGDYIRISVGTEEENEELISCIKTYLSR